MAAYNRLKGFVLFLDFLLLPVLNIPLSRLLSLTEVLRKIASIFSAPPFYFILYLIISLFVNHLRIGLSFDLYWLILKPFLFALGFYLLGTRLNSSDFLQLLRLGLIMGLVLNLSLLILEQTGVEPIVIAKKLNFAALRGDQNLINTTRVSLPFVNPVRLSLFAGVCIFSFLADNSGRKLYLLLAFILLIWSGSRTGLVSVLAAYTLHRKWRLKGIIGVVLIILTVFFLIVYVDIRIFDFSGETTYRHFYLRQMTIESLKNFDFWDWIFGKGLGHFQCYIDGMYSFSVPLTLLFETGIVGVGFGFIYTKNYGIIV